MEFGADGFSAVALSASAIEIGKPFEQLGVDRALPNIEFAPVEQYVVATSRAPFEQLVIDRALPNLPSRNLQYARRDTGTRNDAYGHVETSTAWANDWNFIARRSFRSRGRPLRVTERSTSTA
jgi:hypothetical protein